MSTDFKKIRILVAGKLNAHAAQRVEDEFEIVRIDAPDPALLPAGSADSIRGIAAMAGARKNLIDALPNLEIIANYGVGYDAVDAPHAGQKGVMVTNTPDVLSEEVADTTLGLLLNTVREFAKAEAYLRDGKWVSEGAYRLTPLTLRGRSVGIFGMGRIGQAVARRIEALGLPVSYHNRRRIEGMAYTYHDTLKGLAEAVDTLISVAPGTPETAKAVNAEILKALGPNGVFVNIGRGSTMDEEALAAALKDGTIAAAGLDVFSNEPHVPQSLLDAPNTCLLPHVGSASIATRDAMADLCVDNLVSWFGKGRAITPVPETAGVVKR